jgi:hypothetical protein
MEEHNKIALTGLFMPHISQNFRLWKSSACDIFRKKSQSPLNFSGDKSSMETR